MSMQGTYQEQLGKVSGGKKEELAEKSGHNDYTGTGDCTIKKACGRKKSAAVVSCCLSMEFTKLPNFLEEFCADIYNAHEEIYFTVTGCYPKLYLVERKEWIGVLGKRLNTCALTGFVWTVYHFCAVLTKAHRFIRKG
jgi:hypothetical protein